MAENDQRGPYKTRDLFGVQLEVTSILLETELKKLAILQAELDASQKCEETQLELIFAISRIQSQAEHLEREYNMHALGALKSKQEKPLRGSGKSNRSQPAIGLKYLPKYRPSIFGTVAASTPSDYQHQPYGGNHVIRKTLPQTPITSNGSIPNTLVGQTNGINGSENGCSSSNSNGSQHSTFSLNNSVQHGQMQQNNPNKTYQNGSDWDHALVYEDRNLVSGTIEGLIQHLIPSENYYPDRAYIFAFLLSSRLYIRPHELLGRVFKLSLSGQGPAHSSLSLLPTSQPSPSSSNPSLQMGREVKCVRNLVKLLGEWTELFPYDFRDERMMAHVRTITQKCVSLDPPVRKDVSQLLTALLSRLTNLERYEDFLHRINAETSNSTDLSNTPSIFTTCPAPTMLAQQLTHIELERLSHIGPEEFVEAFAKDNGVVDVRYKDMKKTRNLESYVQWFNRLSYFVATEICKVSKRKTRTRVIEYWIEVARECFNIGNFNSLMAIIAGLNMSPVARLKSTWKKISTSQLTILEHQMDPSSNFTSYRSTLKAAVWRSAGAVDERQRIVIPFFSLLVKDLYFLNEGCLSKLANGYINFEKFWQLAKQVTEVIQWQAITCPFPKVEVVLNAVQTAPIFTETALCLASYLCEPAENGQERERLKYLRKEDSNAKKIGSSSTSSNSSGGGSGSGGGKESSASSASSTSTNGDKNKSKS